jgi:hypothetical protein
MKRIVIILTCLFTFTAPAMAQQSNGKAERTDSLPAKNLIICDGIPMCPLTAQNGSTPQEGLMTGSTGKVPAECPMNDMMQSMIDVMKMQQKIIAGVKPSEKRTMLLQINSKMEQMEKLMTVMRAMPMPCMPNCPPFQNYAPAGE